MRIVEKSEAIMILHSAVCNFTWNLQNSYFMTQIILENIYEIHLPLKFNSSGSAIFLEHSKLPPLFRRFLSEISSAIIKFFNFKDK